MLLPMWNPTSIDAAWARRENAIRGVGLVK